jgi:hypothetical protein
MINLNFNLNVSNSKNLEGPKETISPFKQAPQETPDI